jgi:hypothetical protein
MSLETAIRENTAALQTLTAALLKGAVPGSNDDLEREALQAYRDHEVKKRASKPVTPAAVSIPAPVVVPLDYVRDVKPLVLKLAAQDRPALLGLLDDYGVAKAPEVPGEKLPEFLARVEEFLK